MFKTVLNFLKLTFYRYEFLLGLLDLLFGLLSLSLQLFLHFIIFILQFLVYSWPTIQ